MREKPVVWIAEAVDGDGIRTERVVHCTRKDAEHDIEILAPDAAWYDIQRERLYTGRHGELPEAVEVDA